MPKIVGIRASYRHLPVAIAKTSYPAVIARPITTKAVAATPARGPTGQTTFLATSAATTKATAVMKRSPALACRQRRVALQNGRPFMLANQPDCIISQPKLRTNTSSANVVQRFIE